MSVPSVKSQLLQEIQRSSTPSSRNQAMAGPPPAYTYEAIIDHTVAQIEDEHAELDMDVAHSPINIKISCPINVVGNANLIAINPSEMSSCIASCITRGFKDYSMARAGIPMIDEEGRPRPIDVQVEAGITVRGLNNTIGKEAAVFGLRATRELKRRREQTEDDDQHPHVEGNELEESDINKKQRAA